MHPSSSGAPGDNPVLTFYHNFLTTTPFTTRATLQTLLLLFLLSFFLPLDTWLSNTPLFTIQRFELYRLILSPLICVSFMSIVFVGMTFKSLGSRLEQAHGSIKLLLLMIQITVVVNTLFVAMCLLGYYGTGDATALMNTSQGESG